MRKTGVYFHEGFTAAKSTIYRRGNFLRYYLSLAITLFGYLFIFTIPFVKMMNAGINRDVLKRNDIQISRAVNGADNSKGYYSLILSYMMKLFMFLGITLVISLISFALYMIGMSVFRYLSNASHISIIMASIGGILLIAFLVYLPYSSVPNSYVVSKKSDLETSLVLFYSFDSIKHGGKMSIFISFLFEYGIKILYITTCAIAIIGLSMIQFRGMFIINTILITIFSIIYLIYAPIFSLTGRVMRYAIYSDVMASYFVNTSTKGIQFSSLKKKSSGLEKLFDETKNININVGSIIEDPIPEKKEEISFEEKMNTQREIGKRVKQNETNVKKRRLPREYNDDSLDEPVEDLFEDIVENLDDSVEADATKKPKEKWFTRKVKTVENPEEDINEGDNDSFEDKPDVIDKPRKKWFGKKEKPVENLDEGNDPIDDVDEIKKPKKNLFGKKKKKIEEISLDSDAGEEAITLEDNIVGDDIPLEEETITPTIEEAIDMDFSSLEDTTKGDEIK